MSKNLARGETTIPTHDLCHNWSIVWTKEMISEFLHKLNPIGMTYSTCWNLVFPEYNHHENMLPLLDELLRREKRVLKFDFF